MTFRARRMRQNDIDIITYKDRFQMKHARICELINKSLMSANFYQTDINNNDYNHNDCVDYVEFKKRSASLV